MIEKFLQSLLYNHPEKSYSFFVGLQIRQILSDNESRAWNACESICNNFLENDISENYRERRSERTTHNLSYVRMQHVNKIISFLAFFPENLGAILHGH